MKTMTRLLLIGCLAVSLFGCEQRTDRTDSGGVLLSVSDFNGLPTQISVSNATFLGQITLGSVTIQNIVKDPLGLSSSLMNVEMQSYEVMFTRADTGTRVPPPLVREIFGVAPVNGTEVYLNLPIMSLEQLDTIPLSDLLIQNGSFDKETGLQTILLNFRLRFFGRTLSGDAVESEPVGFTVEFVP